MPVASLHLELVAFGEGNVTIAVSETVLFKGRQLSRGPLPPRVKISQPREVFTSQVIVSDQCLGR